MLVFVERSIQFSFTLAGVILWENALSLKATAKFGSMTRKMLAICCFHHISWTLSPEISLLAKKTGLINTMLLDVFSVRKLVLLGF